MLEIFIMWRVWQSNLPQPKITMEWRLRHHLAAAATSSHKTPPPPSTSPSSPSNWVGRLQLRRELCWRLLTRRVPNIRWNADRGNLQHRAASSHHVGIPVQESGEPHQSAPLVGLHRGVPSQLQQRVTFCACQQQCVLLALSLQQQRCRDLQ